MKHELRINLFFIVVLLTSSLILYRLFILSFLKHSLYSLTAQAQNENISNILARGNIYLRNGDELFLAAANKKFPLAYLIPAEVDKNKSPEIAEKIAGILGMEKNKILEKINSGANSLRVLSRRLSDEKVRQIKELNIKGVGISYEMDRFYPSKELAANVIGFLGYDDRGKSGQYGIEAFYNQELFGKLKKESRFFQESSFLNTANIIKNKFFSKSENPDNDKGSAADRPADIVLALDKNIQLFAEDKLEKLLERWNADAGTIIVQEPDSGKILAMADKPSFDPNSYSSYKTDLFLNKSLQAVFEPGSSFKPITMAAGLDLGKVNPQATYEDDGFINIAGYNIHNFSNKVFGTQTMSQVLEKSINTGAMFVENQIGDENFLNYVINMGFGQRTDIDLPGEVNGDIVNLYSGRKINYLTASFGQGIAVTPLQLVNAYSAIANGGKLMRPYVVEKLVREGGIEEITQPEIISIPISEKTSAKLKSMLVSVVDNGFDKARIKGYDVAGKTGTAQIPDGKGGYSESEFIHDFVGFAPAYNPKFVILIKIDKPKGITFAADSLSPVFREITAFLLNYYKIPPTRQ